MLRERATAERWIPHAEAAIRGVRGGPLLAADLLNHRGVIANLGHEVEAAERFHREALAIRRAHLAPTHVHVLDSLTNIGLALLRQRRLAGEQRGQRDRRGGESALVQSHGAHAQRQDAPVIHAALAGAGDMLLPFVGRAQPHPGAQDHHL